MQCSKLLNLFSRIPGNKLGGFLGSIAFEFVKEKFNISPLFYTRPPLLPDKTTGRFEMPGSVAAIRVGQSDLAIGSFSFYPQSNPDVDFLGALHEMQLVWATLPPHQLSPIFNIFYVNIT